MVDFNLDELTNSELNDLISQASNELRNRQVIEHAEAKVEELMSNAEAQASQLAADYIFARDKINQNYDGSQPPAWVQPAGAHEVYPEGYRVVHKGKTWINTHRGNSWEPGTTNSQWVQEVDGSAGPVEWAVGQAVVVGDVRIYQGRTWVARVAHVTHEGWTPSEFTYAVWEEVPLIVDEEPADPEPGEEDPPVEEPIPEPEPEEPPAPTIPAWSAQATYKVGDKVTYGGRTYECLVAHGAEYQGTWRPDIAHSVWKVVG